MNNATNKATESAALKDLERAANEAARKVSELTLALEKAQATYAAAHEAAKRYRESLAARETERKRTRLTKAERAAHKVFAR